MKRPHRSRTWSVQEVLLTTSLMSHCGSRIVLYVPMTGHEKSLKVDSILNLVVPFFKNYKYCAKEVPGIVN